MAHVTCRTPECGNAGHSIDIDLTALDDEGNPTDEQMPVVCGVCGQPITDVTE